MGGATSGRGDHRLGGEGVQNSETFDRGGGMRSGITRRNRTTAFTLGAGALLVIAVLLGARIAGRTGLTDPQVRVITQNAIEVASARLERRYQAVQRVMTGEVAT